MTLPVLSFIARSGTGKTTLLEKIIHELKQRGYRVGAIKHDAHKFDIDHEGKDSWRLTQAGADLMLISSAQKLALVKQNPQQQEPPLEEIINNYCRDIDILLTEGFKRSSLPKIEVHRQDCGGLISREEFHDANLIAVASDSKPDVDVPLFNINDAAAICQFIIDRYLSSKA